MDAIEDISTKYIVCVRVSVATKINKHQQRNGCEHKIAYYYFWHVNIETLCRLLLAELLQCDCYRWMKRDAFVCVYVFCELGLLLSPFETVSIVSECQNKAKIWGFYDQTGWKSTETVLGASLKPHSKYKLCLQIPFRANNPNEKA